MSEANQITCPHCGQNYAVEPEQWGQYQGKTIPCSKCGQKFTVGALGVSAALPPITPADPVPGAHPVAGYRTSPGYGAYAGEAPKTSGIAVASLVMGIASFLLPVILSIPAIICGAIGMSKTKDPRVGGRGLAIAGLVLGICSIFVGSCYMSIMLPALNRAREQANRVKCASNMRQIGLAIMMYSNQERNGAFPDSFDKVVKAGFVNNGDVFVCPSSNDTDAGNTTQQIIAGLHGSGHDSYTYIGSGIDNKADGNTVVLYEPPGNHRPDGGNFLFADGHVEFLPKPRAQKIIAEIQAGQNPPPSFVH